MTPLPTWADLRDLHCTSPRISENSNRLLENPYYEEFSQRRFNYSPVLDKEKFRFVFLKDVLSGALLCAEAALSGVTASGTKDVTREDSG